jgi:MATE family multidrug resistance protein
VTAIVARELGENRYAVREVRRTVRQGFWSALAISLPIWVVLWNTEPILLALGQEPGLAADAEIYMRSYQWALLPFLLYLVLRSFMAALERPNWALVIGAIAFAVNALAAWCLIFGKLGFPGWSSSGRGSPPPSRPR